MTAFEWIIFLIGSLGLLLALNFLFKRRRIQTQAVAKESGGASWWDALSKTRSRFFSFSSSDETKFREALEEACIVSDLGVANTTEALEKIDWPELKKLSIERRSEEARRALSAAVHPWLSHASTPGSGEWPLPREDSPTILWFVGVNGVGKTTSIAKLAAELKSKNYSVLLAAGDTFRAAAGEQLELWAERLGIPCVRGQAGADSSSILFDAIQSAVAKKIQFVLCDSAGRLHNQNQLMEALQKNKRAMEKALPGAPHETLLVRDANTGQNMLNQAQSFMSSVGVTGLILSKLDGTAKGGAIVAVARQTQLPIRRLGLGEGAGDLVTFNAERFSEALFGSKY